MKKIRMFLLLVLFAAIYTVNIDYVSAEEVKLNSFDIKTRELFEKEKIYFDIDYSGKVSFVGIWAKEKTTNEVFYVSTSDISDGYFDLSEKHGTVYNGVGSFQLTGVTLGIDNGVYFYTTNGCNEPNTANCFDYDLSNISFTIKPKEEKPELLKNILLYKNTNNYYIGDKITFNVETTEEISSINVEFYNPVSIDGHNYGMFTVHTTPECTLSNDKTTCNYSGYIPKTIAGYYATTENGRTEMTIYPGTYHINSIFIYGKNGQLTRYTTNKEFADKSDFLYHSQKIAINIQEPIADELNDVNFVLNKLTLNNQTAAIGKESSLYLDYTYNNTNKKLKSIYLIFRDPSKNRTFTSYVKSLTNNPYFIIASSADLGTYKLDSIGVTFESNAGTNNTIIINGTTSSGKYSEIFNQQLTINGSSNDNKLYFSAEELNEEIYHRIQNSQDDEVIIDADKYTIIPSQLFDLIKESTKRLIIKYNNNEWIFNGADIKNSKNIDVFMKFYEANASNISDNIKKALNNETIVLEFPDNGELPGNVLIRIKDSEILNKLTGDKYYVYYVDTETGKLKKVALDIQKTSDGYIEFNINHNSKYLISNTEITDETIIDEDDTLLEKNTTIEEEQNQSNNDIKDILLCSIIVIIVLLIIVFTTVKTIKKRNKNKEKSEN